MALEKLSTPFRPKWESINGPSDNVPLAGTPAQRVFSPAAGVHVDDRVAANFFAMWPALPMPVVSTLPGQSRSARTASSKAGVTCTERIAAASSAMISAMRS